MVCKGEHHATPMEKRNFAILIQCHPHLYPDTFKAIMGLTTIRVKDVVVVEHYNHHRQSTDEAWLHTVK